MKVKKLEKREGLRLVGVESRINESGQEMRGCKKEKGEGYGR